MDQKNRLGRSKQAQMLAQFVAGATARPAASLVGVNKTTAAFYFHRLRQLIHRATEEQTPFAGEIKVKESYFGGRRKGKRGHGAAGQWEMACHCRARCLIFISRSIPSPNIYMKRIHPLVPVTLLAALLAPWVRADNQSLSVHSDLAVTGVLSGDFVAPVDILSGRTYPITGAGESDNQVVNRFVSAQFAGAVTTISSGTLDLTPNVGVGHISGNYSFAYTQGGEGVADSYSLTYNVTASSLSATETDPYGFYGSGLHANAHINISVGYLIPAQPIGFAPTITLMAPAAGTVLPGQGTEFYSATIRNQDTFGLVGSVVFGDAPKTVALASQTSYYVEYDYSLDVPFGIDPTVSLTVNGEAAFGAAAVPEPAPMAAAAGAVLLGWALVRRRN